MKRAIILSLIHIYGGGEFLGGEAVASAYHLGHAVGEGQRAVGLGVEEGLDLSLIHI